MGNELKQKLPDYARLVTEKAFEAENAKRRKNIVTELEQAIRTSQSYGQPEDMTPRAPKMVETPVLDDTRTTQQKLADAQSAYDSYMGSQEREQNLQKANRNAFQEAIDRVFAVPGASMSDMPLSIASPLPKDEKEQQLKAEVNYLKAQLQAEEDRAVMDKDLAEYNAWSEEDRNNLDRYITERNMAASQIIGEPQFDKYNLNPLVQKYGLGKVRQMAESIQRSRNEQTMQETRAAAEKTAQEHPVLGSLASVGTNLVGAYTGPVEYIKEMGQRTGRYQTLDPNNLGSMATQYGSGVRQGVSQRIQGEGGNWLRTIAAIGYEGVMSAADSVARLAAGGFNPGISAGLAASQNFGSSLQQYSAQGATPEQAAMAALASSGIEYLTEKIPMDELLKVGKGGKVWKDILKQTFLVEPTTEEISLFANVAAEAAILGEKSDRSQRIGELIAGGATYKEAKAQVNKELWNEAARTYAVSAVSGFAGSGGAAMGNRRTDVQVQQGEQDAPAQNTAVKPELTTEQKTDNAIQEAVGQWMNEETAQKKADRAFRDAIDEALGVKPMEQDDQEAVVNEPAQTEVAQTEPISVESTGINGTGAAEADRTLQNAIDEAVGIAPREDGAGIKGTGAAEADFTGKSRFYDLLYEGNVQRDRPGDVRPVEIPKVDTYGRNVSEFVGNAAGAAVTPDTMVDQIERMVLDGALGFDVKTNEEAVAEAMAAIKKKGTTKTLEQITRNVANGKLVDGDIEKAMLLYAGYANSSKAESQERAAEIFVDLTTMAHMTGRNLQLFRLIRQLTPEGKLMVVQRTAQRGIDHITRSRGDKQTTKIEVPQELGMQYVQAAMDAASPDRAAASYAAEKLAAQGNTAAVSAAAETAVSDYLGFFQEPGSQANITENDLVERMGQRVADALNRRAAEENVSIEDILFRDIMQFVNDKVNPQKQTTGTGGRDKNLRALADYHRYQPFFRNAWDSARRRAEAAMQNMTADDPRIDVIEDFLATYSIENNEVIAGHEFGNPASTVRRAAAEAARNAGFRMDNKRDTTRAAKREMVDVLRQNAAAKQQAVDSITQIAAKQFGLDEAAAEQMAQDISDAFYADLSERSAKEIQKILGPKTVTEAKAKSLAQKLGEIYNLGALDTDAQTRQAIFDTVFGDGSGVNIPNDLLDQYVNAAQQRQAELEKEIYKAAAAQLKANFAEKWDAWRYMSMLGNLKTQVRNVVGNVTFLPYVELKNKMAAIAEKALPQDQRTKAVFQDRALLEWAKGDAATESVQNALKYSAKLGDDVAAATFREYRRIFDSNILEKARNLVESMPRGGDMFFKNQYYARSLAGFLKARGYTIADVTSGQVGEDILMAAREYATKEAMKATFNDANAFSDMVASIGFQHPDTAWKKIVNKAVEGKLPFRRTPANIAVRFAEYSPIGIIQGVGNMAVNVASGKVSAATAIDQISSGITGSAAMVLGYLLAKGIGCVKLTGSEVDEDEKRTGKQEYALEISINGEVYSYRIDWAAPANLPLFMGANLCEIMEGNGADADVSWMTSMFFALGTMFEPMLALSQLSGLNEMFESARYAPEGQALYSVAVDIATGYFTQGIPALVRQAYQATQENKQAAFANSPDPTIREAQQILSNVPFAGAAVQTDRVNEWGETENMGGPAQRAFNAFINPGTVKKVDTGPVETELARLRDVQEDNVTPPTVPKKVSYTDTDGNYHKDIRLTEEQYQTFARVQGETAADLLNTIIRSKDYRALTDAQKASVIDAVYSYAQEQGKQEALPNYHSTAPAWMEKLGNNKAAGIIRRGALSEIDRAIDDAVNSIDNGWKVTGAAKSDIEAAAKAFDKMSKEAREEVAAGAEGETAIFLELRLEGLSTDDYLDIAKAIAGLKPEAGKKEASSTQKWEAISKSRKLTDAEKDAAIKAYMTDYNPESSSPNTTELKYDYARQELGISPEEYIRIIAAEGEKAERIKAWQDMGYTKEEAAALWNLLASTSKYQKTDVVSWYNSKGK